MKYDASGFPDEPVMKAVVVALQEDPPDKWDFTYQHTGGGIMCILAVHESMVVTYSGDDWDSAIYIGTANDVWGWSSESGDQHGDIGVTTDQRFGEPISSDSTDVFNIVKRIRYTLESWIT